MAGRKPKPSFTVGPLLAERLLPCQLDDIECYGGFNVRGGYIYEYRECKLWRIVTHLDNQMYVLPTRRLIDWYGEGRNFWFYDRSLVSDIIHDNEASVLALMLMVQAHAEMVHHHACNSSLFYWDAPTIAKVPHDYGGKI